MYWKRTCDSFLPAHQDRRKMLQLSLKLSKHMCLSPPTTNPYICFGWNTLNMGFLFLQGYLPILLPKCSHRVRVISQKLLAWLSQRQLPSLCQEGLNEFLWKNLESIHLSLWLNTSMSKMAGLMRPCEFHLLPPNSFAKRGSYHFPALLDWSTGLRKVLIRSHPVFCGDWKSLLNLRPCAFSCHPQWASADRA